MDDFFFTILQLWQKKDANDMRIIFNQKNNWVYSGDRKNACGMQTSFDMKTLSSQAKKTFRSDKIKK